MSDHNQLSADENVEQCKQQLQKLVRKQCKLLKQQRMCRKGISTCNKTIKNPLAFEKKVQESENKVKMMKIILTKLGKSSAMNLANRTKCHQRLVSLFNEQVSLLAAPAAPAVGDDNNNNHSNDDNGGNIVANAGPGGPTPSPAEVAVRRLEHQQKLLSMEKFEAKCMASTIKAKFTLSNRVVLQCHHNLARKRMNMVGDRIEQLLRNRRATTALLNTDRSVCVGPKTGNGGVSITFRIRCR